jgi:class 3 adenylate cyclase
MTVHVACRIQEQAAAGETLVSCATAQFTSGDIAYRSRGEAILKGVREPVELYSVLPGPASPKRGCREQRARPVGTRLGSE